MQDNVRLINANALKKEMVEVEIVTQPYSHFISERVVFGYDIDDAPTIDAVEVVRCWKCKHYTPTICHRLNTVVTPFDFCSYGKPKMDAKDMDVLTKDEEE